MTFWTAAFLFVASCGALAEDYAPPIVHCDDLGNAPNWRGFPADGSKVCYETELKDWSRTNAGGLATDSTMLYEGKPTGRLISLESGYLAFRPAQFRKDWDSIEFALHNATPGDGMLQFRIYFGYGGLEKCWDSGRHGFFFKSIPLNYTGWKTWRLRREDFTAYGGPIGWENAQLFGIGLHVTQKPSNGTDVRLADLRLASSPIKLSADHDLLRSEGSPLRYSLTIANRDQQQNLPIRIRCKEQISPYSKSPTPFTATLSEKQVVLAPGGTQSLTLLAKPQSNAQAGDMLTFVVDAVSADGERVLASQRIHAVMRWPKRNVARGDRPTECRKCPDLKDADRLMRWAEDAATAYMAGNDAAGKELADALRRLGDPVHGYRSMCVNRWDPPAVELKTWYEAFHWNAPVSLFRAYEMIYDTDLLSESDKRAIDDNFLRPLGWIGTLYLNACANGQEQRIASTLAMGLASQDPDLIHCAIDGPVGFVHAIGHDMPDGFSNEGTTDYNHLTWTWYVEAANMASRYGIDLFHMPCPIDNNRNHLYEGDLERQSYNSLWSMDTVQTGRERTLMDCLWGMLAMTYPDGRLQTLNDSILNDYLTAYTPPPYITNPLCRAEVGTLLADPKVPDKLSTDRVRAVKRPSINMTGAGLAILRTGDGNRPEDQYLLLKYGPHGGCHGHKDKLQFTYGRYGKELASDSPICDLNHPGWNGYFHQSASHNTIVVDGKSQMESTGERCLTFVSLPGVQVAELEAKSAYIASDVRVRRLAVMSKDYVVLIDRVFSDRPHTIDFLLHGAGKDSMLSVSTPLAPANGTLGKDDGYEFVNVYGQADTDGRFEANWDEGDGVGLHMMSLSREPTRLIAAKGLEGYRRGADLVRGWCVGHYRELRALPPDAVLVARRESRPGSTEFVTVLEGTRGNSCITSAKPIEQGIEVLLKDGNREVLRWTNGEKEGQPTQCQLVRELEGKVRQMALIHGRKVDREGVTRLETDRTVEGCSVEYEGGSVRITARQSCDVRLSSPQKVEKVLVNGETATAVGDVVAVRVAVAEKANTSPRFEKVSEEDYAASLRAWSSYPAVQDEWQGWEDTSTLPLPEGAVRWLARKGFWGGLAWSPDGTKIAAGGGDGTVTLWDAATGAEVQKLTRNKSACVFGLRFSPDGKQLAAGFDDNTVAVWEPATADKPRWTASPVPLNGIVDVAFSPDSRLLATSTRGYKGGSGDERAPVILWDAVTGQEKDRLYGSFQYCFRVMFSPDGEYLVTPDREGNIIRVWETANWKPVHAWQGHRHMTLWAEFSPDSKTIASASQDKTVIFWDVATGKRTNTLNCPGEIYSVSFSPNGKYMAGACLDKVVRIWDVSTSEEIAILPGHASAVRFVAFSPDGTKLASMGFNGSVLLWQTPDAVRRQ